MVGKRVIPETSKIGSIAKGVLVGGALGGFFDDPPLKANSNGQVRKGTAHIQATATPTLQVSSARRVLSVSASDGSEGAFSR